MNKASFLPVALVVISAVVIIIILILKNKRDKKLLNPDAQDSVKESKVDHERRSDKI